MHLTSGLHGPRVLLNVAKTFDDFVVISVICFTQDNLESNFTPRYERLATLESGCSNSEYWCELGLVLFVIGRCTHFDKPTATVQINGDSVYLFILNAIL